MAPRRFKTRLREAHRLLPQSSKMAGWMLSVAILREDLLLEMRMMGDTNGKVSALIGSPDLGQEFFVRTYFFRGSMRSLYSAKAVLDALMGMEEFKDLMNGAGRTDEFKRHLAAVHQAASEFSALRNRFGGHVERDVPQRRASIRDDEQIPLTIEHTVDGSRFGGDLAHCAVLACLVEPSDSSDASVEMLMSRMSDATSAAYKALDLGLSLFLVRSWGAGP